jgi:hypothetical protein
MASMKQFKHNNIRSFISRLEGEYAHTCFVLELENATWESRWGNQAMRLLSAFLVDLQQRSGMGTAPATLSSKMNLRLLQQ